MPGTLPRIVPFGWWSSGERCYLLSWNAVNGWLSLSLTDKPMPDDRIAHITSEERLENALVGWTDHIGQPNSVTWLTSRLDSIR